MRWLVCLPMMVALVLTGCTRLEPPAESGVLVVAIDDDPVFSQPGGAEGEGEGFERDLARAFAAELHVEVRFVTARGPRETRRLLRQGKAHLATAQPMEPTLGVLYSQPLHEGRQLIVRHAADLPIDNAEDLAGHVIEVIPGAPQIAALRALRPAPEVVEVDADNAIDLLGRVNDGHAELAATDATHFDIAVNFYPDIVVAQELPGQVAYAWAFRFQDGALRRRADAFIERIRQDGTLSRLKDRYYGHIKRVGPNNMAQFLELMRTRLPRFRSEFHQAQLLTGIDWRLLAALAYQESNWDPLATSPTGVRGMMMLTEDTADRLRVGNRLDSHQSIQAGARYLADLMEAMPAEARNPDRNWLALAAYNLGPGHFNGAVAIARNLNRDPASWYEMKQVLPLLARPQYYARLKAGRARGGEAVIMVENIRTFHDVLSRFEPAYTPPVRPR